MHWVTDHLPVLKKIRKSLKPSGWILFQMGGKGNAKHIIKVMEHVIEQAEWNAFFNDFNLPYGFCSPDEYRAWLPYTQRIPESLCEDFIQAIVKQYIKKYPADKYGRIHLQMKRLEVQA